MKTLTLAALALSLGYFSSQGPMREPPDGPLGREFARTHPRSDEFTDCMNPEKDTDVTEIALERTSCYGACPMYTLVLRSNGTAEYHGRENVQRIGNWNGTIDRARFRFLAAALMDSGFFRMREDNQCGITDNPTVFVAATRNGVQKLVRHYAPGYSHPAHLVLLEQAIDAAGDKITWHRAPR